MKFRVIVTAYYENDDKTLEDFYGTTDPHECAEIDELNIKENSISIGEFLDDICEGNWDVEIKPIGKG